MVRARRAILGLWVWSPRLPCLDSGGDEATALPLPCGRADPEPAPRALALRPEQGHQTGTAIPLPTHTDREIRMAKPAGTPPPEPEFVQLLTPEGERVEHPDYKVDFTDEEYRSLYHDLVVVRRLDAEATALQRQGELGIWASLLGQEAAQVGSGRAMRPQDMAFPTYREHGVLYCRGIDPIMPLGLFRGVDQGGWDPNEFKFQMYTIVIGAQTLHAVGYAMGVVRRRRRRTSSRRDR